MNLMAASNMEIGLKCFARNHSEFQTLKKKIQFKTCKYCIVDKGKKKEGNA